MHTNAAAADIRPMHRIAVLKSIELVDTVESTDLDRPTPCEGWDLADLLAHMTVQHRGFAAAARGLGTDLAKWDVRSVVDAVRSDPAGSYAAAAHDAIEAFGADGALEAPFALPEFGADAVFPGTMAIGFHFVDYVVHGWDVAASLGVPYVVPTEVLTAVLPFALAVPDGEVRSGDGAPFGPAAEPAAGDDLEQVLRHLGRRPDWSCT